jgi:hypothetical protein
VFKGLADFILFKNPAKISKEIMILFKKAIKKLDFFKNSSCNEFL